MTAQEKLGTKRKYVKHTQRVLNAVITGRELDFLCLSSTSQMVVHPLLALRVSQSVIGDL